MSEARQSSFCVALESSSPEQEVLRATQASEALGWGGLSCLCQSLVGISQQTGSHLHWSCVPNFYFYLLRTCEFQASPNSMGWLSCIKSRDLPAEPYLIPGYRGYKGHVFFWRWPVSLLRWHSHVETLLCPSFLLFFNPVGICIPQFWPRKSQGANALTGHGVAGEPGSSWAAHHYSSTAYLCPLRLPPWSWSDPRSCIQCT